jgi:hypothetical protein
MGRWRIPRDDHIDLEPDQFGRECGEQLVLPLGGAVLDGKVLSLHPAMVAQPLQQGLAPAHVDRTGGDVELAYPGELFSRWLCLSDPRRDEETQGEGDNDPDGAAPHRKLLPTGRLP